MPVLFSFLVKTFNFLQLLRLGRLSAIAYPWLISLGLKLCASITIYFYGAEISAFIKYVAILGAITLTLGLFWYIPEHLLKKLEENKVKNLLYVPITLLCIIITNFLPLLVSLIIGIILGYYINKRPNDEGEILTYSPVQDHEPFISFVLPRGISSKIPMLQVKKPISGDSTMLEYTRSQIEALQNQITNLPSRDTPSSGKIGKMAEGIFPSYPDHYITHDQKNDYLAKLQDLLNNTYQDSIQWKNKSMEVLMDIASRMDVYVQSTDSYLSSTLGLPHWYSIPKLALYGTLIFGTLTATWYVIIVAKKLFAPIYWVRETFFGPAAAIEPTNLEAGIASHMITQNISQNELMLQSQAITLEAMKELMLRQAQQAQILEQVANANTNLVTNIGNGMSPAAIQNLQNITENALSTGTSAASTVADSVINHVPKSFGAHLNAVRDEVGHSFNDTLIENVAILFSMAEERGINTSAAFGVMTDVVTTSQPWWSIAM